MSQDHSDRFFESDSFFLKVGQRPVTRAAEEKRFPRAQPCTCTSTLHSYIYIYIYMVPHPPPCTHACLLNLGFGKRWVLGMPLFPCLSPKSQLQNGVG